MEIAVDQHAQDEELAALAHKARGGNAAAFDTLARRVYDRVRQWALRLSRDHDEADDVAQVVLLRLHARIDQFEGRSRFTSWLYRITRNVAFSRALRDRHRHDALARRHPEMVDALSQATRDDDGDAAMMKLVTQLFKELPPRQREVFELGDLQGLNSTDIAHRLGITASTARGLLMKARRRIRLRILEAHPRLLEEYRNDV
jgi:RNA polymerase sigma-70 factor (ECF subfamily)